MKLRTPITAIIGAGQVGATTAQRLIEKDICDVALLDVVPGLARGKALDLMQAAPIEGHDKRISGTESYDDLEHAEIVVITAGLARKPGMSREDLLAANAKIITSICENLKRVCPDAIIITVTNPLDIMTYLVSKHMSPPKEKIMGMAGVLDSARMRYFLAEKTDAKPSEISAMVLGSHGDLMVPVMSHIRLDRKTSDLLSAEEKRAIIQRTQQGGAEIVSLLKSGSAFYAPASSVAEMVTSIVRDERKVLPACAYLTGQYGIHDTYCGVPVKLGRKGILEIVEIPLTETERKALLESARKVQKGIEELEALKF